MKRWAPCIFAIAIGSFHTLYVSAVQAKSLHDIEEMILSFREGGDKGLSFFFKKYNKAICYFAKRYLTDPDSAEDVASEVFIRLWANREKIKNENHLRNWLYMTAYHLSINQLEKSQVNDKHLRIIKQSAEKYEKDYCISITKAETLRQLKHAIDLLPGQCKKVFYKLYIEGKTVKQAAEELQLAIKTIDSQKTRGIKLLRKRLAPYLGAITAALFLPWLG